MAENDNELSFKELILKIREWWSFLISKWMIILIAGIIGGGIGLLYAIYKKGTYTATLTFVLSNDSKNAGGLASIAGQFGLDIGGLNGNNGAFEGDNIIELLKSKKIIKGALLKQISGQENSLVNLIGEKTSFFQSWRKNKMLSSLIPFPKELNNLNGIQDSLIGVIHSFITKNYLNVSKPDKKLSFYQVSSTSENELISVYLTKYIVEEASKMYIDTKTKLARENLAMLQHEADSLRNRLSGTIYESATRIDYTFNLNPALQTQRVPIQQNQVQAQVLGTAYGEVVKNLEIAKITLQKETPLYQVIDEPTLPLTKLSLSKLKAIIFGSILTGLFSVIFLVSKKIFKMIMHD